MPAASSKAELLELAAERSSFKPAASWNPTGRPRFGAGGWVLVCGAGRLLRDAGRCGAGDATGWWSAPSTAVDTTVSRAAVTCVDEELVLDEDVVVEAPGYGTGRSALWCAGGGATGLGAAWARCADAANARSVHAAANILPSIEAFALTTRVSPSSR